jgi:hypothetical protein
VRIWPISAWISGWSRRGLRAPASHSRGPTHQGQRHPDRAALHLHLDLIALDLAQIQPGATDQLLVDALAVAAGAAY